MLVAIQLMFIVVYIFLPTSMSVSILEAERGLFVIQSFTNHVCLKMFWCGVDQPILLLLIMIMAPFSVHYLAFLCFAVGVTGAFLGI